MGKQRIKVFGNILQVRKVEDCIRATHKYAEDLFTSGKKHPLSAKDAEKFASKAFSKHYEVFPEIEFEIGPLLDMDIRDMFTWIRKTHCVDVRLFYDYRDNVASVMIKNKKDFDALKGMSTELSESFSCLTCKNGTNKSVVAEVENVPSTC